MDKGAHFYSCDFQVHTPRDRQWRGDKATTPAERNDYAIEFVLSCREKSINAVAITDHHDLTFVPYIREAARNERDEQGSMLPPERQLVVFPGMELTLGIPCQALLIFDANLPDDMFQLVKNALAINQADDAEERTVEVQRMTDITSFAQLYQELDKHSFLRGKYTVLPNVSEGGASTLLRSGHSGHYKDMPCLGGYLDGSFSQLGSGNKTILSGKDAQYGYKPLALFQTSDNRRRDFADLGRHVTWVKWATPTAEALRQACLARDSRISQSPPFTPSVMISSVSVSTSKFLGPFALDFSPQYNAIIGGRGTGKSTILEYVRWALCDDPAAGMDDAEQTDHRAKRSKLIEKTLAAFDANAQVNFQVNGVPHSVRRHARSLDLSLKIGQGVFEPCTEADVRRILPVQAYSQKQLSSVGVRLDELKRFVYAPIRQHLDDVERDFAELAATIRTQYAQFQKRKLLLQELEDAERELRSLSEQVIARRGGLSGMRPEDQVTISEQAGYEEEEQAVETNLGDLKRARTALGELSQMLQGLPSKLHLIDGTPNSDLVHEMGHETAQAFDGLRQTIAEAASRLEIAEGQRKSFQISLGIWKARREAFRARYEEAKQRSSAHEATLTELTELEARVKIIRDRITATRTLVAAVGDPEVGYDAARQQWRQLLVSRAELLQAQCTRMTDLSGGLIRVTVRQHGGTAVIEEKLKSLFSGTNLRGSKIEDLCAHTRSSPDPLEKWMTILADLQKLSELSSLPQALPTTPILRAAGLTDSDITKIGIRLTPETWLELSLVLLEDEPQFEYRARENEYIAFADASAGQQATALLRALLNQEGPPLIIDQPEDDLDNQVILDIVEQIWKAKTKRQIIFTSHNANLVVNGDAELVICCDYRVAGEQSSGMVKHEGAIDVEQVRETIAAVMEGGKEAFKLRRDKYGF